MKRLLEPLVGLLELLGHARLPDGHDGERRQRLGQLDVARAEQVRLRPADDVEAEHLSRPEQRQTAPDCAQCVASQAQM
jgi:hypothetical protein